MSINADHVKHIAHLARIEISDDEIQPTLDKLSGIIGLIEEMQAINTDGISPMSHSQDVIQRLRQDEVTESNQREQLQSTAPAVENGLYLVPKVIE